jgi:uncharacterized protein (DUF2236 family)
VDVLREARETGQSAVEDLVGTVRATLQRSVRRALGVRGTPPLPCSDPALAYLPVDGAAREIHADLPSMLVGGVASLLLQMLHPLAMAGVAQHSRYREDPLGRLARTATFIGTTTYGSRADAAAAVARVRAVHERVRGVAADTTAYHASDPHLLEWVHVAELTMFLAGVRGYGPRAVDTSLADRYVAEMAVVASDLGVLDPPRTEAELAHRLEAFRPELALGAEGREARHFVLRGVSRGPSRRAAYATIVGAGVGVLPGWARRQLEIPSLALSDALVVRPAATALCAALRLAVPPAPASSGRDR